MIVNITLRTEDNKKGIVVHAYEGDGSGKATNYTYLDKLSKQVGNITVDELIQAVTHDARERLDKQVLTPQISKPSVELKDA